jgi:signal transduction histidine kinase
MDMRFNKVMPQYDAPEVYGEIFRHTDPDKRRSRLDLVLTAAVMAPLAISAAFTIRDVADPARLTVALLSIAAFAGLFVFFMYFAGPRAMLVCFVAETAIVALLSVVPGPRDGFLFIIFAILSAQLGMTLRPRVAAAWFVALIVITLVSHLLAYETLLAGLLSAVGNATGFFFFVLVGGLVREALLARERSELLTAELRAANDQLQALSLQAQQLAVSEERNRMARELHDSLGHRLTVAVVQLEGAQRLIPSDPERAARMVSAMREQMKEALGDLRSAVAALRAPLVDDLPLDQALARLAQSFQEGTGVQVSVTLPEALPDLLPAHRLALFRAAQEALTNAQRHSAARHVWLDVCADDGTVTMTAADDGRGLDEDTLGGGFGLRGLQERAAQLGGSFSIGKGEHGGAELIFRLPIQAHNLARTVDGPSAPAAGKTP